MEIHGALMSITRTTRPLHVGDIAITPLFDGHLDIPAAYFSNASDEEIQAVSPTTRFGATCWLIETGPRKVLVDAGSGSWLKERFPDTGFITAAGSSLINGANEITDIILTHLHADHIGGLIADGQSLFPNATVHLQNTEWAFWTDENLVEAVPEDKRPIAQLIQTLARPIASQVKLHDGDADLENGIHVTIAPGHTPGHQIVRISSGGEQVMLLGDALVSGVLQFANPDVHYALDSAPETAAETRKTLFSELAAERIPLAATHLESAGFGMLTATGGGGYHFEPLA
jgi:glyoxylase-like metal-dependent hydrolase (beta-lactamase superfamily II)